MDFVCTKCGSVDMRIESKGSQTGLYCCDCGKWSKWLTKDEISAFNFIKSETKNKCVVIESENLKSFEDSMNKYLEEGYKVDSSSCNSSQYKAILILNEN